MRFQILIIIVSVFLLSCSSKKERLPAESQSTAAESVDFTQSSQLERPAPLEYDFESYPLEALKVERGDDLKARLGGAIENSLAQLRELPAIMVFGGGVSPIDEGAVNSSNDYTAAYRNYWLVGSSDHALSAQVSKAGIDVWHTDPKASESTHVSYSEFAENESITRSVGALHVVDSGSKSSLVVRRNRAYNNPLGPLILEKPSLPGPDRHNTSFEWFDVNALTLGEGLIKQRSLSIDGEYISSTRRGDRLYVITRHWAWALGLNPFSESSEWLNRATVESVMPSYRFDGEGSMPLSSECLVVDEDVTASLLNVTVVDLAEQKLISSQCINRQVDGVLFGDNSLYLSVSRPNLGLGGYDGATELHQLSLNSRFEYQGGGLVPGTLALGSRNKGFKELSGILYMQTTQRNEDWSPIHNVFQIHEFDGKIKHRGLDGLYLRGYELLESRFVGSRAYLIPEDQTMPVRVVSLEVDEGPTFMGEMWLDSNSPAVLSDSSWVDLGSNQVLSVVNRVNEASLSSGVGLALMDLSDVNTPVVLDALSFGGNGTHSTAVYDLREVVVANGGSGSAQIALPITVYSDTPSAASAYLGDLLSYSLVVLDVEPKASMKVSRILESYPEVSDRSTWGVRGISMAGELYHYFDGQLLGEKSLASYEM